jgi:hypothetical protein
MAVLKKIKENFGDVSKGAVAGAMMLGAVAMPFASASAADGKVQYKDIRAKSAGYVEAAGHVASGKNRIALMVKGGEKPLLKAIYSYAKDIENSTGRDVWFLHTVDDKPNDGVTEVDIYVSGRRISTLGIEKISEHTGDALASVVEVGIEQTGKTASLEGKKKPAAALTTPTNDNS